MAVVNDAVSWNVFRYAADYLHFGGMLLGLGALVQSRSCQCFSRKTQVLFQLVFVTRYLDVLTDSQVMYLVFFKVAFNLITAAMLCCFVLFQHTYDAASDSCNLVAILVPTALAAWLTAEGSGFKEEAWTWSEFLEPFALVPQYIVCYRATSLRPVTVLYVLAVGGYRVLYVFNWIYKRSRWHTAYHDYTSWLGGAIECALFFDFVFRLVLKREDALGVSQLGRAVLNMDEGAGKLSEMVELRTIGRRLPYGISGPASKEGHMEDRWEASDKLMDEEGCKLLTLSEDADY